MIRTFAALSLVLSGPALASDPLVEGPGLDISLVSEHRNLSPGKALTVGFHIHHYEGFHTYWQGPGIVGVPTSLKWKLPEGFTASEIRWPYPEKTFMAEYPCHGYERDVTLLVTITPPELIKTEKVTFEVEANWMCCAKGCFPGFQTLTMTLPVSDKAIVEPKGAALIEKARKEVPSASPDLKVSVKGAQEIELKIDFPNIAKAKEIYFFSCDGQISSDQKQKITPGTNDSIILTVPRSEFSPKEFKSLPGVLKIDEQHLAIDPVYPS